MVEKVELTPATFAVFLITRGCIPSIFNPDLIVGQLPVEGHTLTGEERGLIGLKTPGTTIGYRIGQSDVFFDMAGDNATVWFAGGDYLEAAPLLREALKKNFGAGEVVARQLPVSEAAGTRTLELQIQPAQSRRAALLSITVGRPRSQDVTEMFFCRIYPQERLAG